MTFWSGGPLGIADSMPLLDTALSRKELLTKVIKVLETFDPKKTTVDAWMTDCPLMKDKRLGDIEQKFIHQIFYGCSRYQKFLKLFVTSFLYKCPTTAVRSEQTVYTVLSYLLFFRLEELEVAEFRELLKTGVATDTALLALLEYAFDVEEIEKWVKVEWCKIYDCSWVEEQVISKLQNMKDEFTPVLEEIELKATGTVKNATGDELVKTRKTTVQKPFNLTKIRPRLVPEPEVISRQVKAQPAPASSIAVGVLEQVEEEKKQRLEEHKATVKGKYNPDHVPNLKTGERAAGNELEELTKKVDAERMVECTFKPAPAKKYVPPTEEAVVRQNVASVLREDALLRKKQANEAALLKRYEADLHDASTFNQWQQEQKQKDDIEEEVRVRQRMVEMQLARDEARDAVEHNVRIKTIHAEHKKEETKQRLVEAEFEKQQDLVAKEQVVQETQDDRIRARLAENEVAKARAEKAEALRKEKEAEQARKKREDEHEMERRKDLIRQIRALEKVPVENYKAQGEQSEELQAVKLTRAAIGAVQTFDAAEQPVHGLLEEMSIAELRERLKLFEAQQEKELADKRERQLHKKAEKQQEFAEKAETLAKIREMAKDEAKGRHSERKARAQEIEERKVQYRDKCIEEAAGKIAAKKKQKRDEESALKKELKDIATKNSFRSANAEMVEAKAHGEQQNGLEREARDRQVNLLFDQRKRNEIGARENDIRTVNRDNDFREYRAMQDAVKDRVTRALSADVKLKGDIQRAVSQARNHQRAQVVRGKQEFGHSSNKYIQKMGTRMATSA